MIKHRPEALKLAELLQNHQDEIANLWAEEVHKLSGTRYSQRPFRELHASALRGVAAIVESHGETRLLFLELTRREPLDLPGGAP